MTNGIYGRNYKVYEKQYLEALMNNDTERMAAIERLNGRTYVYSNNYKGNTRTRDELTALWGEAYNPKCKS